MAVGLIDKDIDWDIIEAALLEKGTGDTIWSRLVQAQESEELTSALMDRSPKLATARLLTLLTSVRAGVP